MLENFIIAKIALLRHCVLPAFPLGPQDTLFLRDFIWLCLVSCWGVEAQGTWRFFPWWHSLTCTEFLPVLDKIRIWGVQVACWAVYFSGGLFCSFRNEVCVSCLSTSVLVSTLRTEPERPVEVLRTLKTKPWKKLQQQLDTTVLHFPGFGVYKAGHSKSALRCSKLSIGHPNGDLFCSNLISSPLQMQCVLLLLLFFVEKRVTFIWDIQNFDLTICWHQKQLCINHAEIIVLLNKDFFSLCVVKGFAV